MGVKADKRCKQKGLSLIIAVFSMMLLAVLGMTLAMMISGDFESNTRDLESEQAFNLAEAGIQEAVSKLRTNTTVFDDDSKFLNRKLGNGEYNVTRATNGTLVTVVSSGFVPSQLLRRAMRQIKAVVPIGGGLTQGIGCGGIFDWSAARAGHTVDIDADISAAEYNGDGNGVFNQLNSDYGTNPILLPPGAGARNVGNGSSTIPMQWYHDNSDCEWPNPGTRVITNTAAATSTSTILRVTGPIDFFTGMVGQAVRNVDRAPLANGSWADDDWKVITAVTESGRAATVDTPIINSWSGNRIRLVRRYSATAPVPPAPESGRNESGGNGSGINYIGATISHAMGYVVDTVIDLRSSALSWEDVKIICEGDIFIKGPQRLQMTHSSSGGAGGSRHPPLATQNGNIICLDATTANNRIISGLIFSETGIVRWNFLRYPTSGGASWLRGNMIYGQNIFLDGDISVKWLTALAPPEEAQFGSTVTEGNFTWQEQ